MMSLETIEAMARKAARRAARKREAPHVFFNEAEVDACPSFPIPLLGGYAPRGWKPIGDTLFCDSSGFGADDEPALSVPQFKAAIKATMAAHPGRTVGWAVVEAGEFQVCVQAYLRAA